MPESRMTPQGPMSDDEMRRAFGFATLQPTAPVVAGSLGTWRLTYTVGEYGLDDGGTLMVSWRFATDWGRPQFDRPRAPDYCTVSTDGAASLSARFDTKAGVRPWRKSIVIDVFDDGLRPGEQVHLTVGDTSGGSPGSRAQTFCERSFEWRVQVNPFATGEFITLPDPPEIEVIAGPAARLVAIVPSTAAVGEQIEVVVKAEDEWGNPATGYAGTVHLQAEGLEGLPEAYSFTPGTANGTGAEDAQRPPGVPPLHERHHQRQDAGVHRLEAIPVDAHLDRLGATVAAAGVVRVIARDEELGAEAQSNPLLVAEGEPPLRIFWADPHGQSEETVGTNSAEDYFRFARDYGALDIVGHQGNDFQVTAEVWAELGRLTREYTQPGRFVALPGYEWSGNTGGGGDHNVYLPGDDDPIFRSCHALIPDKSGVDSDRYPVERLYEELRERGGIAIPHVGGRRAELSRHHPEVVPAVEVYSAWGEFEWMLTESLALGHRVGVVAGSDGHKCRPGASYPGASQFGAYGGLTGIIAPELTREAVFEALRSRRCYATTGQRILLSVRADGRPMGSELTASGPVTISVAVHGTAGIRRVELLRGDQVVHTHDPLAGAPLSEELVRIIWSGARILGRDRATIWDGRVSVRGATIIGAWPYAFDGPQERLTEVTPTSVSWRSLTTGDEDGLTLRLAGLARAELRFETRPAQFVQRPGVLGREPWVLERGGVGQRVSLGRLPEGEPPLQVAFDFTAEPPPGTSAWWVRVTQDDGARAWSSPIFIERG